MRLRRMWAMTGGAAFGAIPVAAQAEQGAMQAAMVGAPMGQFGMGGITAQAMQTQAAQQQFQIQMGRGAARAWGWLPQAFADTGLGTAAGVGLPAAGLGLAGAWGAGVLGLGALAPPLGLGIAAGATLIGGANLMRSDAADIYGGAARTARAFEGGIQPTDIFRSGTTAQSINDIMVDWANRRGADIQSALTGTPREELYRGRTPEQLMDPGQQEQLRLGRRILSGELSGLDLGGRAAAISEAYEVAPQWMQQPAAEELARDWMRLTPGATNIRDIYQDPRFEAMAARGMGPENIREIAGGMGIGQGRWQEVMDIMLGVSEQQFGPMTRVAQQWMGQQAWGEDPLDILRRAAGGEVVQVPGGNIMRGQLERFPAADRPRFEAMFQQQQNLAMQQRMAGMAPIEMPTTAEDVERIFTGGQMQVGRAGLGLQQTLTGLGAAPGAAGRAADFASLYGVQGIRGVGGLLGGDPTMLNMMGLGNVGGGMAAFGDTGLGLNTDQLRAAFVDSMSEVIPPQFFDEVMEGMDALKPLRDEFGRPMGAAQMTPGYAAGFQLPSTVDPAAFAAMTGDVEAGGRRFLRRRGTELQQGFQDFQMRQARERLDLSATAQFGGTFESPYGGGTLQTRGTFAIQAELRNLSRIWEDFTSDYGQQQRELSYRQTMENIAVREARLPIQFGRQREDLAFQGQQASINFGWQMEDVRENLRFATGRDRRRLLRQQERAAISFGMGQGRLETMGERVDENERWAQEDSERQRRHAGERRALENTFHDEYRRYVQERRRLEDELQQIREFQARFNIDAQTELIEQQRVIQEQYQAIAQNLEDIAGQQANWVNMIQWLAGQADDDGDLHQSFIGMINSWVSAANAAARDIYIPSPGSGGGSKR
jgi:hypothetical protein